MLRFDSHQKYFYCHEEGFKKEETMIVNLVPFFKKDSPLLVRLPSTFTCLVKLFGAGRFGGTGTLIMGDWLLAMTAFRLSPVTATAAADGDESVPEVSPPSPPHKF